MSEVNAYGYAISVYSGGACEDVLSSHTLSGILYIPYRRGYQLCFVQL